MNLIQISSVKINLIVIAIAMLSTFVSEVAQASVEITIEAPVLWQQTPPFTGTAHRQIENGIFDLGHLGERYSYPKDISADGHVVVGMGYLDMALAPHAFLWTRTVGMTDLGAFGAEASYAAGVSDNGVVVVGSYGPYLEVNSGRAFRWTQATGMVDLGTLGGQFASATGVSADGNVVIGVASISTLGDSNSEFHGFRWTQTGGMTDLGTLGGASSWASSVSGNGEVVVGESQTSSREWHAFRWEQASAMADLGTLGGDYSSALGVSYDGSVVVGNAVTGNGEFHGFRWTQSTGMADLGTLGGSSSMIAGLSENGSVVVGHAQTANLKVHAFRWTPSTGMADLGTLGGTFSTASNVSADGQAIVGASLTSNDMAYRGFRWTQNTGMQSVEDWLRSNGVTVSTDITANASATNRDGSVVVGQLENGQTFIARVSSHGSGLVTIADVQESLYGSAHGSAMATSFVTTAINGAHSRPLSRQVEAGKRTFWLAGDWGRDDHGSRSGDLGLAEAGLGYNFGPLQVNISLGQTWANQHLTLDGRAKVDGTYLQAEALVPVTGKLWATLGAYGHWGDANLRRAYLNGGLPDFSTAQPAAHTWGLRARLDWDNAIQVGSVDFSPYIDLTYSEARLDAYSETGGGFPARFDARQDRATDLRLGGNATYPLTGDLRLLGTLEAVHRFETSGARTTGEVIGIFGFDLAGMRNKQDWLRLGGGIEGPLAGGKAMLSINATTQGEAPNVWLAANWQVVF